MISFIYKLAKEMNDKMLSLRLNQSFLRLQRKGDLSLECLKKGKTSELQVQ